MLVPDPVSSLVQSNIQHHWVQKLIHLLALDAVKSYMMKLIIFIIVRDSTNRPVSMD